MFEYSTYNKIEIVYWKKQYLRQRQVLTRMKVINVIVSFAILTTIMSEDIDIACYPCIELMKNM